MPENYGFTMNMTGDAATKMTELQTKMGQTASKAQSTTAEIGSHFEKVGHSIKEIFAAFSLGTLASQAITSGFSAIEGMVGESANKFLEADKGLRSLKFTVNAYTKEGAEGFEKLNSIAESSTMFKPTEIIKAEKSLLQYGFSVKEIVKLTPMMENFAAINPDLSLEEVAQKVIRGTQGMKKAWMLYDVDIQQTNTHAKNLANIEDYLGKSVGATGDFAKTAAGHFEQMNVAIEKQEERLGASTIVWKEFTTTLKSGFMEMMASILDPEAMKKSKIDEALKKNQEAAEATYETVTKGLSGSILDAYKKTSAEDWKNQMIKAAQEVGKYEDAFKIAKGTSFEGDIAMQISEPYNAAKNKYDIALKTYKEFVKYRSKDNESPFTSNKLLNQDLATEGKNAVDALKKSSLNTSALGGASGGLGQAKVINISIENVQKIVEMAGADGKEIQKNADNAIPIIIRTINNLSYSQSGTM
jgi:hypothetical protein